MCFKALIQGRRNPGGGVRGPLALPSPQFLTFTHGCFARIIGCFKASHASPPPSIVFLFHRHCANLIGWLVLLGQWHICAHSHHSPLRFELSKILEIQNIESGNKTMASHQSLYISGIGRKLRLMGGLGGRGEVAGQKFMRKRSC